MKKYTFIAAICLLKATSLQAQTQKELANNKVKNQVIVDLDAKGSELGREEYVFDTRGNVIQHVEYEAGKIIRKSTFTYNSNDQKTGEVIYLPNGKKDKEYKYLYKVDLRIERQTLDADGKLKKKKVYKYDYYD